jgi:hypothetical protein
MAKKPPSITASKLADFAEIIGQRHCIDATVGPQLEPVILSLASPLDYRFERTDGTSFAKQRADHPNQYAIHFRAGEHWLEVALPETKENYHSAQPLGQDHWLAVRGRSGGDNDCNAHVFDASGRRLRSFPAGDGIQEVQADEAGKIWVSYFDEGVFGDCQLSHSGLVCLDDQGRCVFDFLKVPHSCVSSMADCYALNVCSSREVWLCYYTDFPLVQLLDHQLANVWHRCPISGSPGFAVSGDRVLFAGGYKKRELVFEVDLHSLHKREFLPVDQEEKRIRKFTAFGRGSSLFLVTEESLFAVELGELA